MPRPVLLERSLAVVAPAVAGQVHPTRNGPVDARLVSAGSSARLWWACLAGHDWEALVSARTRGAGCPTCAGHLPTPTTCLAAVDPVLAGQWHPRRNSPLTPAEVLPSSGRRVWWQCPAGHGCKAKISSRTRGSGCPACPRPRRAATPLAAARPDLAAQWDTTANGELTPDAVTAGSTRRVRWRCDRGHRWTAAVYSRTSGTGCPYCAGRRATPETSLAVLRPDLLAEWAADLNGTLDPATVGPGSHRRVWWRCPADPAHVWQTQIGDRTRGVQPTGCPYCTGIRVTAETSLAVTHPQVAAEWDPTGNGIRTPDTVHPASNSYASWRCPAGHRWQAQVTSRTTRGSGCPYCAGKRATPATSLAAADPALAAQWDPTRNGTLTPAAVRPASNVAVWWACPVGHTWRAQINQRFRGRTGCPDCALHGLHGRLLAATCPDLAVQWVDALNGGGPGPVTTGSRVKAWWQCPTHLWRAEIRSRTRANTGCPYCAHTRPTPTTCLAAAAPHLVSQWHPTRNGALSPTDVLPHSGTPVWWQCIDHHQWAAAPADRVAGTGCPDCAARHRPVIRRPVAESML